MKKQLNSLAARNYGPVCISLSAPKENAGKHRFTQTLSYKCAASQHAVIFLKVFMWQREEKKNTFLFFFPQQKGMIGACDVTHTVWKQKGKNHWLSMMYLINMSHTSAGADTHLKTNRETKKPSSTDSYAHGHPHSTQNDLTSNSVRGQGKGKWTFTKKKLLVKH